MTRYCAVEGKRSVGARPSQPRIVISILSASIPTMDVEAKLTFTAWFRASFLLAVGISFGLGADVARAVNYTYTMVDIPAATCAGVYGINVKGQVAAYD